MLGYVCKRFVALSVSVVFALVCFVGVYAGNFCRLSALKGARTFYLYSASSQAVQTDSVPFLSLREVLGESVRFEISALELQTDEDAFALGIGGRYEAKFLFREHTGGVTSYYFYAPALYEGVAIEGRTVNLQVAVSQTRCVVGSPIIFGGF